MRFNNLLRFFILFCISIAGCTNTNNTPPVISFPTQTSIPITETPIRPNQTITPTSTPTIVPTLTLTPLNTLEPAQANKETLQPLLKEPMNCVVPCFWGIIPGQTHLDEARIFFSKLGFTPFEGVFQGKKFYTISYDSGTGHNSRVTLTIDNNLVKNVEVTPDIPKPKEGSPREWIAYSPETLITRYGSPSSVRFTVSSYGIAGLPSNTGIDMIMYFDTSDLIVAYSGYGMTPESFCPLTASFDFVRLWIGPNPPNTPSFETVPLEKATSLTIDQFTQLMLRDPKKACFTLNQSAFP